MLAFAGNSIYGIDLIAFLKVLVAAYGAVLFLQSGSNKLFDWQGNKSYIASVFQKTFLRSWSTLLFVVITILEVTSGLCCVLGVLLLLTGGGEQVAALGLMLSAVSILCLFSGMRIAQDYAGSAAITPYLIFFVVALALYSI
ncbi:MAG: DoxX family membrane protein [Saprospiraceae bacterium]|nr:DoxX family membrane protein [Saprospiraceae bacterium]